MLPEAELVRAPPGALAQELAAERLDVALAPITVLPAFTGMASPLAGLGLGLLAIWFVVHALRVRLDETVESARAMFRFSLLHLSGIFVILLLDRGVAALFR